MTVLRDSSGQSLPDIECPSDDLLRVYGDMMFLAFRSARHMRMPLSVLRTYFEAPLLLGQFRVFRFDAVPRAAFTWGFLSPEAERKLVVGEHLDPQDWNSGDRLWIVDIVAPYRGLTASLVRWIMVPGRLTEADFRFRRVADDNRTRRIVHIDFRRENLSEVFSETEFLASLP